MIILLDLDGTIIDSQNGIRNGLKDTFKKFGVENIEELDYFQFIGPPLQDSLKAVFETEEEIDRVVEVFRKYYDEKGQFELEIYDGMEDLIREVSKEKRVAVATAKPQDRARDILERLGVDNYLEYIAGAVDGNHDKAEIIRDALKNISYDGKEEVLMVGDRFSDVVGAKNAGVKCVGVLYGYGTREELISYGADYIVNSVEELKEFLKRA